ncbi:DUF3079 domain-containing protein [Paracidovorax konjaci]|uniref:DUF3079 domain-containing protein n=1 Tax=Paracidovorax konjaci TaxID=32040 RepID=A0A1I1XBX6_9BURK|nr:DUF3079 domain-containing protein [Paracidovorax konjaci]SFE04904.1 Protein of unknown function [Paracidovorax konjaci]
MQRKFPDHPAHPERICWGCDRYCPAGSMACGNGSDRTPHPVELFGDDWRDWKGGRPAGPAATAGHAEAITAHPAA